MVMQAIGLLRSTRERTLTLVSELSQQQMDWTPAPGKWSIGQVVDHLLLSEKLYREQIAQLVDLAKAGKRAVVYRSASEVDFAPNFLPKSMLPFLEMPFTVMNLFVPVFVRDFVIRNAFIPAQSPGIAEPRKGRPAGELCGELRSSIEASEKLIAANPELNYQNMRAEHPMLGSSNVPQLIRLTALHEQRHHGQIEGIRKNVHFPRTAAAAEPVPAR